MIDCGAGCLTRYGGMTVRMDTWAVWKLFLLDDLARPVHMPPIAATSHSLLTGRTARFLRTVPLTSRPRFDDAVIKLFELRRRVRLDHAACCSYALRNGARDFLIGTVFRADARAATPAFHRRLAPLRTSFDETRAIAAHVGDIAT